MHTERISWIALQNQVQLIAAICSIFLNLILILLIIFRSPKDVGTYRYLMGFISCYEILYSILDVLVSPFFHSYGSTFLLMVNLKSSQFSPSTTLLLTFIYCAWFGTSLAIFGIHFIYRFLVVTGSPYIKYFKGFHIFLWLIPLTLTGLLWAWTGWFVHNVPITQQFVAANIMDTFNINVNDTIIIGPYFYQKLPNGKYLIDIDAIITILIIYSTVNISFFTIIYFGVKVYRIIQNIVAITSQGSDSKAMQSQLFFALVTQTLIPVILMHVPITVVYAFAIFDKDIGTMSGIVSITISLFPAIDPLPNIFIIKHYREGLKECIMNLLSYVKIRKKVQAASVTQATGQPTESGRT